MALLKRLLRALPLLLISPFFMAISFLALVLTDIFSRRLPLFHKKKGTLSGAFLVS